MNFFQSIEILVVFSILVYFIKKEKPQLKFFFLALFFFFISLLLQFPLLLLQPYIHYFLGKSFIPVIFFVMLQALLTESLKYYSLKRKLKTRSMKNALLFGLTWVSLESISLVSFYFYFYLSSLVGTSFSLTSSLSSTIPFWTFFVLFSMNSLITYYIIISIVKRKKRFFYIGLFYAIAFSILILLHKQNIFLEIGIIFYSFIGFYNYKFFFR